MRGSAALLLIFTASVALSGCASDQTPSQAGEAQAANDPFEPMNRQIFDLDRKFDEAVLKPTAEAYNAAVPEPARNGAHNFLTNLNLPVVFANDVLQGNLDQASKTFGRFGLNSTFGVAGVLDWATDAGLPYRENDFGLTLASYGVGEGPYLVLPFFGPDPPRDAAGQVADIFLDPTYYIRLRAHFWWSAGRYTLSVIDERARNVDSLEGIERSSVDLYASVRSLYRQHRRAQEHGGKPDVQDLPNL
jgi:phospholipid-binding lipoprotein MlaA